MRCPYYINDLCYSGLPSSTVKIRDYEKNSVRRVCETSKFRICPKYQNSIEPKPLRVAHEEVLTLQR